MKNYEQLGLFRTFLAVAFLLVGTAYLVWRSSTLGADFPLLSWALYLAEIYGFMSALLHIFMCWRLTIRQNGKQVYSQVRRAVRTDDASPRAEVQWDVMRPDDVNARERFVLRATNLATGEVCRTTLREA